MNNTETEEKKIEKRNILLMILLALAFIIGISTRWQETKDTIKESVKNYISIDDEKTEEK